VPWLVIFVVAEQGVLQVLVLSENERAGCVEAQLCLLYHLDPHALLCGLIGMDIEEQIPLASMMLGAQHLPQDGALRVQRALGGSLLWRFRYTDSMWEKTLANLRRLAGEQEQATAVASTTATLTQA